jgi:hypothetical protein
MPSNLQQKLYRLDAIPNAHPVITLAKLLAGGVLQQAFVIHTADRLISPPILIVERISSVLGTI